MRIFKFFLNFEREEQWLTQMLRMGHKLTSGSLGYGFTRANEMERECVVRVDYREFSNRAAYADYLQFMKDFGWERLFASKDSGKQYFIQREQGFDQEVSELFSTEDSMVARYKSLLRLSFFFMVIGVVNLSILLRTYDIGIVSSLLVSTPFSKIQGHMWVLLIALTCLISLVAITVFFTIKTLHALTQIWRAKGRLYRYNEI